MASIEYCGGRSCKIFWEENFIVPFYRNFFDDELEGEFSLAPLEGVRAHGRTSFHSHVKPPEGELRVLLSGLL